MKHLKYLFCTILFLLFVTLSAQNNKYKYSHKHSFKSSIIGDTIDAVHYDIYLENIDFDSDKIELEEYAKEHFGKDIDRRIGVKKLRKIVQEMIDGNS